MICATFLDKEYDKVGAMLHVDNFSNVRGKPAATYYNKASICVQFR
jgi:hypothetical protein